MCSGEWCMATATSHEATKSNCVATDCALGGPRGGSSATRAAGCTGQEEECEWEGGWGVCEGHGVERCLSGKAAAVTWTVERGALREKGTKQTSEMKQH